ncbi:filamentous hemagglutinin N-terminal domain-containing protein [Halotia branconii]|uniref:Filamentous hemagglutinin N-terminal domain-containing protein n=1 Tax=Halotia branconii CENA392 TaxID=1539056 RepID=A0AAJ6PCN7_9CYAN|nr:filamentous hemagglutinin N-terminal domain-containing protein [Halotia branconii]WGV29100.1 filamentous hemagglutinin N-terminal domain-containing protein [Halotia branconii CENA392]
MLDYSSVIAEVIPDQSLPVNSTVTLQDHLKVIDGGTVQNNNLFHSFEQFSIPKGNTVLFNNSPGVQNIFSRVTGLSSSKIDGLIKANGTANLFLINPNGINFGQNARLDIGGSFFASTANTIKFADSLEFSAINSQAKPLLSVNMPIGLQYDNKSGDLQVQGTGQGLIAPSSANSPIIRNNDITGLRVEPGKTLALVGGNVILNGATLTAEQGRVEVGSVASGLVSLNPNGEKWVLGYEGTSSFKDIQVSQQALVDSSGSIGGSIAIQGKLISLSDGSVVLNQSSGSQPWGDIKINASESLQLSGASPDGRFISLIRTESLGSGDGGNIEVFSKRLLLQEGGAITNRNYSNANGGNVTVNALDSVQLLGFSPFNPFLISSIVTSSLTSGKAGNIAVSTGQLDARDGGQITSIAREASDAGNVTVNATGSIKLTNSAELIDLILLGRNANSLLSSVAFGQGNSGNLAISTPKLIVGEQATINTSTTGSGSAGFVDINAFDIEVKSGASISSAVIVANASTQQQLSSPPNPSGDTGKVRINTNQLRLTNGIISVRNLGKNEGGTLEINSKYISLDKESLITAATIFGEGGNISLNSQYLQLRRGSSINATAGNSGNGGNININTRFLVGSGNSSIAANAFEGRGGNIQINTRGFFFSPGSIITASSQLGIDGTVKINDFHVNPTDIKAAPAIVAETPAMASGCTAQSGIGKNMLTVASNTPPPNFDDHLDPQPIWHRDSILVNSTEPSAKLPPSTVKESTKIIEAQGLVANSRGNIELVVTIPDQVTPNSFLSARTCSSVGSVTEVFPSMKTE